MVVVEKDNQSFPVHLESLTKTSKTILTVQHVLLHQIRRIMDYEDFIEVLAPVTSLNSNPRKKTLSDLAIYKQTLIRSFERVYTLAPKIKEGSSDQYYYSRQLFESYQLELEMRETSIYDAMEIVENTIERLMNIIELTCSSVLDECERDFIIPSTPFSKISYSELHRKATSFDNSFNYGDEIPSYVKEAISHRLNKPIWIVDYPIGSRKVPYRENSLNPGYLSSVELIYPKGNGLAASGGERITDVTKLISHLKSSGEDLAEYHMFLGMMETDGRNSTGFTLGIEPLVNYVLG